MSVNKVILVGRLGKDPEVKNMTNGEPVANVTLATTESWKDKSGSLSSETHPLSRQDDDRTDFATALHGLNEQYCTRTSHSKRLPMMVSACLTLLADSAPSKGFQACLCRSTFLAPIHLD